jgi:RNA polymerase sigma-70 factor (ECF subfamily)
MTNTDPNNISQLSDNELITRYQLKKDIDCIAELYKRYTGFVFSVSMKYLKSEEKSTDAVLDIFEDLIEKLLVHNVENFRAWLYSVTKNYCMLYFRSLKQEINREIGHDLINHAEASDTENFYCEKNLQLMEDCMGKLKSEQRLCIDLFFIQEKSYVEIGEITGFSLNQVKSFIQNGKRNLKLLMEENYEE